MNFPPLSSSLVEQYMSFFVSRPSFVKHQFHKSLQLVARPKPQELQDGGNVDLQIILPKKGSYKRHSLGVQSNLVIKVQHGWHFVQRESALEMKCLSTGLPTKMVSSLLSVHPVGPEIWGACRMLLTIWFADFALLRSPRERLLMWLMF